MCSWVFENCGNVTRTPDKKPFFTSNFTNLSQLNSSMVSRVLEVFEFGAGKWKLRVKISHLKFCVNCCISSRAFRRFWYAKPRKFGNSISFKVAIDFKNRTNWTVNIKLTIWATYSVLFPSFVYFHLGTKKFSFGVSFFRHNLEI